MPASEQGLAASRHRYQIVPRVLCFVLAGDDVLLLKGAPDKKIWPGQYNGLGGHVERGESPAAAARREIREEAGLEVAELRLRGIITIDTGEPTGIGLYVFTGQALSRDCQASVEGSLEWVPRRRVADLPCVADVPVILERLARVPEAGAPPVFSAHYTYDPDGRLVMAFE
jgi:8-oxo-dGTP diphosphatase